MRLSSKRVIEGFFSSPPSRSLVPQSQQDVVFPLQFPELERLGKLAGLDVSSKSEEFSLSVAKVLNFCKTIEATKGTKVISSNPPLFLLSAQDKGEEMVGEGGIEKKLLLNAEKHQEGFFVAPLSKVNESE